MTKAMLVACTIVVLILASFATMWLTMKPEPRVEVADLTTKQVEIPISEPAPIVTPAPAPVAEDRLCSPKYKLGEIVYEVQTGWKGQIGIVNKLTDYRNDSCWYTVIMYNEDGRASEDEYWEFQLRK